MTSAPAWDAHAHVIGDLARYPFARGRDYTPGPAPLEAYLALLDRLGVGHGVLVQPSVYGFDNRCLLDALDRAGGRLYGVAVPSPDSTGRDLEALHARGIRAVRCNAFNPGGLETRALVAWRSVMVSLGWHVQLHVAVDRIAELPAYVDAFGVPVVFDHMGHPSPGLDPQAPGLKALVELARAGLCYVKLSAPYRLSSGRPPWPDVAPLARALVAAAPRACLWATDWPHTQTSVVIEERHLVAALEAWCPEADVQSIVTAHAARELFGG